uniref:Phosphatidate cytidylyltransferase, mitochondrial n=1 Tax=Syphacia muris TaxID=451379 RepID=A0A0N5AWB6_9BILA
MAIKQSIGDMLKCLPKETVEYAFAYGSGAFRQFGETTSDKMVDFIVVTNNSAKFHNENLKYNSKHYSLMRLLGSSVVTQLQQKYGARVYFNTRVRHMGRMMKYGVVSVEDLQHDLLDWRWLFLAGRLHKPVLNIIGPSESIASAMQENRKSALQAALLLLPETFNINQFLRQIVALSYNGDFRMFFGEDKNKIEKIAVGNAEHLEEIYKPMLEADSRILVRGSLIEQDLSSTAIYHRLQLLPSGVLERLQKSFNQRDSKQRDIEEVTFSLANRLDVSRHVATAIESIVAPAAWSQTVKNVITAGIIKSLIYSYAKVIKMIKSL